MSDTYTHNNFQSYGAASTLRENGGETTNRPLGTVLVGQLLGSIAPILNKALAATSSKAVVDPEDSNSTKSLIDLSTNPRVDDFSHLASFYVLEEALAAKVSSNPLSGFSIDEMAQILQSLYGPEVANKIKTELQKTVPALQEEFQNLLSTYTSEDTDSTSTDTTSTITQWDYMQGLAAMFAAVNEANDNYNTTMYTINAKQDAAAIDVQAHMLKVEHHILHKMHKLNRQGKTNEILGDIALALTVAVGAAAIVCSGGIATAAVVAGITAFMASPLFQMSVQGLAKGLEEAGMSPTDALITSTVILTVVVIAVSFGAGSAASSYDAAATSGARAGEAGAAVAEGAGAGARAGEAGAAGAEGAGAAEGATSRATMLLKLQRFAQFLGLTAAALTATTGTINIERALLEKILARKDGTSVRLKEISSLIQANAQATSDELQAVDQGFISDMSNLSGITTQFDYLALVLQKF